MLISRTDAHAGCGRPTLNFIEHFELGSLRVDTANPLHELVSLGRKQQHRMYTDYVTGLCFAFFVFVLFCATQVKRQVKSDFCFETKSQSVECFAVIIIRCLGVMKIKDCRTNYVRLFYFI